MTPATAPAYTVRYAGTGRGWWIIRRVPARWAAIAGPYTTREQAEKEATRLNGAKAAA